MLRSLLAWSLTFLAATRENPERNHLLPRATLPEPLQYQASQQWGGNDGPWSLFPLRIGNPSQPISVLISTASQETWAILPDGCTTSDPSNCPDNRGKLFNPSKSTSWNYSNIYHTDKERTLGYDVVGSYGLDTVGLGFGSSDGPSLKSQVVAGIASKAFYTGYLGLGPLGTNFSDFDHPQPSFLATLKNNSLIPSLSWSYTAGAPYRQKKALGYVAFGGYDANLFWPSNLNINMSADTSRDLVVGVRSITLSTPNETQALLGSPILAMVDSTLPYIWLPLSDCQAFEKILGLTWDPQTELYLINSTLHNKLLSVAPTFTFTLANNIQNAAQQSTSTIKIPYQSFDLQADPPLVSNSSRYFPLKRAANDSQYTLGRAFLQESYLIADYERRTFSINQCSFPDDPRVRLETIYPLDYTPPTRSALQTPAQKAGVITGSIIVVVLVVISFFQAKHILRLLHRNPTVSAALTKISSFSSLSRRSDLSRNPSNDKDTSSPETQELENTANALHEAPSHPAGAELASSSAPTTFTGTHSTTTTAVEMDAQEPRYELPSGDGTHAAAELPGSEVRRARDDEEKIDFAAEHEGEAERGRAGWTRSASGRERRGTAGATELMAPQHVMPFVNFLAQWRRLAGVRR